MPNFRTHYDRVPQFANVGSRVKQLYAPRFDAEGRLILEESGQEDLYAYIQSHKQSCDIHEILARFCAGDTSALQRRQAAYLDTTGMPTTYAEALNAMIEAEAFFNQLPVETKDKFGQDFHQFLVSLDKPETLEKLGILRAQPDAPAAKAAVAGTADVSGGTEPQS